MSSSLIIDYFSFTGGACLSLLAGFLLIMTHIALSKLLKHPGSIIFIHTITHLLLDLHWLTGIPYIHS
jgi:hypothetical protein